MENVNYKELKKGGMMRQSEKGRFAVRLHVTGGRIDGKALRVIQEVSEKYGTGEIHLTARQGIEIPEVKQEDLFRVKEELARGGVEVGVCGPTVRTVTACQGCRVCPNGILDSPNLAKEVDDAFYGKPVPHKFKVGINGCANNCLKAEENDIGIKGAVMPGWEKANCTYCGMCAAACPVEAISIDREKGNITIDFEKCIYCGNCVKACGFSAMNPVKEGFVVVAGGKFGRVPSLGKRIDRFFEKEETVMKVIEASIEFFRKFGRKRERFGDTIKRVGFNLFESFVLPKCEEGDDEKRVRHHG